MSRDSTFCIEHALLATDGCVIPDGWVLVDGSMIAQTGTGSHPPADAVIDAHGWLLTPGFIDIHGHGAGGCDYDSGPDSIRTALAVHRAHGTTRSVLSLVTASIDALVTRMAGIAEVAAADPTVLGIHLEGPFLAGGHRGAHDPALLRPPTPADVDRLIAAGGTLLRQITLAPELPGGMEAVRRFVAAGVHVALGHTDCDYERAAAAFDAGADILTHAFNGMADIHHRAPGPVSAAVERPDVVVELICDGVHVHPAVMRLLAAIVPGRMALVSDAMAAAGAPDGEYLLGEQPVVVRDGEARLRDGDSIAGSTLLQDEELRRAVRLAGLSLPAAVEALTTTPARAIGREREFGRVAAGYPGDLLLFDTDLTLRRTWIGGEPLT